MSCTGFFDEYIDWAQEHPTHVIRFVLTSNQKNQVCSYATGLLGYSPSLPDPVTPSPTPISHATLYGENITQLHELAALSKNGRRGLRGLFGLVIVFLYAPIAILLLFSFNDSVRVLTASSCSLRAASRTFCSALAL